jgi:predicted O-methyltransferase YrrM
MEYREMRNLGELMVLVREITTLGKQRGIGLHASPEWDYPIFHAICRLYQPMNVLESGTNLGLSSVVWAFSMPGEVRTWDVKAFDIRAEDYTPYKKRIIRHVGKFDEATDTQLTVEGKKLVFIDGDHSAVGSRKDFDRIRPKLVKDDIILFHDTRKKGVKETVETLEKEKILEDGVYFQTLSGLNLYVWNRSS